MSMYFTPGQGESAAKEHAKDMERMMRPEQDTKTGQPTRIRLFLQRVLRRKTSPAAR